METPPPLLSRAVIGSEKGVGRGTGMEAAEVRERLESLLGSLPAGGCVGAAQAELVRPGR